MLEWAKVLLSFVYDRRMRCRLAGFRPVVMCIIQASDSDRFLFISPSAEPDAWMPPQEGIEPNESVAQAAVRGLGVELGIAESQMHFRRSIWLGCHLTPDQAGGRDVAYSAVKMRGKAYYAALIKVSPQVFVTLNPAEVARYEWLDLSMLGARIATNSNGKQQLIRKSMAQLIGKDI